VYPDLSPRHLEVPLSYINKSLGLDLSPEAVQKLLNSMQLNVSIRASSSSSSSEAGSSDSGPVLEVGVPATRSDILHACDVMEDVAIAYGYNNLTKQVRDALRHLLLLADNMVVWESHRKTGKTSVCDVNDRVTVHLPAGRSPGCLPC
jgi:phenylalanyl-tRNA synthetase beta chain